MYQFELIIDLREDMSAYFISRQPNIKEQEYFTLVDSLAFRRSIATCLTPWKPELLATNKQLTHIGPAMGMILDARWFNMYVTAYLVSVMHAGNVSVSKVMHDLTQRDVLTLTVALYPCRLDTTHIDVLNSIVSVFENMNIKDSVSYWRYFYLFKTYLGFRTSDVNVDPRLATIEDLCAWLRREIAESRICGSAGTAYGLSFVYSIFEHLFPAHVKHSDMDLLKSLVSRIDVLHATTTECNQAFLNDLLDSKELGLARQAIADERLRA